VAKIDPENVMSTEVIVKGRGRKGETLEKVYVLVDEGKKRDFVCWYIDRSQVSTHILNHPLPNVNPRHQASLNIFYYKLGMDTPKQLPTSLTSPPFPRHS